MADNTPVNSQITDAITQANVSNLGSSPAFALAVLQEAISQSMSLAMQNAVAQQQTMNTLNTAILAERVGTGNSAHSEDAIKTTLEHLAKFDPGQQAKSLQSTIDELRRLMVEAKSDQKTSGNAADAPPTDA